MSPFVRLSRPAIVGIAEALEAGRLILPVSAVSLCTYVPAQGLAAVVQEINHLHQQGMAPRQLAHMLKSASASVGALQFSAQCAAVERLARGGWSDALPGLVAALLHEGQRVQTALLLHLHPTTPLLLFLLLSMA